MDDGPATLEDAFELARATVEDGTSDVLATPHVREVDVEELPERVEDLDRRLAQEGIPLRVHCGGELDPDDVVRLEPRQLELIAAGPPERRWLLLEAPLSGPADGLEPAAEQLREWGYSVVIAHPERSPGLEELGTPAVLGRELGKGSRVQLNATSVVGDHGEDSRRCAAELVRLGLASVVASDAHRLARGPALTRAFGELARSFSAETARALVDTGPRELLVRGLARPLDRGGEAVQPEAT